jgi:hypothetical protein
MSKSLEVLPYEQQREPPYLVREPGRVALVMPAVPQVLGAVMVTIQAACCVLVAGFAATFLRQLWRAPAGPMPPGSKAILAFLVGLPVVFITFLAFQVRWWLTTARRPSVLEIRDGELRWSFPGFRGTRPRRVPLDRVRGVSVCGKRVIGELWAVRVRVDFAGWRPRLQRPFGTTDPALAEEAQQAFADALADARAATR